MTNGYLDKDLSLVSVLAESNNEHHYLNELENLSAWAKNYLTSPMIKDYTDHGVEHSKRLVRYINDLTRELMLQPEKKLCVKEIYILLAACYLHDLGMHYQYLEKLPCFAELQRKYADDNVDLSIHENLSSRDMETRLRITREEHHLIAGELVKIGKIPDSEKPIPGLVWELKEFVALVCYGHRLRPEDYDELADTTLGSDPIRPQLLARLLRIGDSLDVTRERVDMGIMKYQHIDNRSKIYWYKHYYTTGLEINSYHGVGLFFALPCTEEDIHRQTYDLIIYWTTMELKIEEYIHQDYFRENKFRIPMKIDERPREVRYRSLPEVGFSAGKEEALLNAQPQLEPMDDELLELLTNRYQEFKEKNADSMRSFG